MPSEQQGACLHTFAALEDVEPASGLDREQRARTTECQTKAEGVVGRNIGLQGLFLLPKLQVRQRSRLEDPGVYPR